MLIGCPITGKNGPEWDKNKYGKNVGSAQSCLGQQGDIDVIVSQIEQHVAQNNAANLVLFGVSKGGATTVNTFAYVAENKPEYVKNIKLVIADCPFATPEHVAARLVSCPFESVSGDFCGDTVESTVDSSFGQWFVKKIEKNLYKNYDPAGINPLKSITQILSKPTISKKIKEIPFVYSFDT